MTTAPPQERSRWKHWRLPDAIMDYYAVLLSDPTRWPYSNIIFMKRYQTGEGKEVSQMAVVHALDILQNRHDSKPIDVCLDEGGIPTGVAISYASVQAIFQDGWEID